MNLKNIIVIGVMVVLISCTNNKSKYKNDNVLIKPYPHTISMVEGFRNKTQLKLSEIADSIKYIVLSKDKKVLLGDVQNIQITDSNIYLKSNNLVMRFDLSGNFLNKFGNIGRGPAEYLPGSAYTLTPEFDKVMILKSVMYEYLIYKPNGELIGKQDLPHNRNLYNLVNLSDSIFMMTFYYIGRFMKEDLLNSMPGIAGLFDLKCQPIAVIANPLKSSKRSKSDFNQITIMNPSFTFFNNRIVLTPEGDTIYEVDKNSIKPGFIINWGNIPHKESVEDFYYVQSGPHNKVIYYKPVIETTTKTFFRGGDVNSSYLFEYDKTTTLSRSMDTDESNPGFINDLDGGANYFPFWTNRVGDIWIINEDAYSFIEKHSDEFLSKSTAIYPERKEKLKTFICGLKQDDNPVIKIVYLKKSRN